MKTSTIPAAVAAFFLMFCVMLPLAAATQGLEELTNAELREASPDASNNSGTTYKLRPSTPQPDSDVDLGDAVSEADARAEHSKRINGIRFNGADKPMRVLHSVFPKYPVSARVSGIEGLVEIELTIGTDGTIENARVLKSPHESLTETCLAAVTQWRFEPITINGQPATVKVIQGFPFKLRN